MYKLHQLSDRLVLIDPTELRNKPIAVDFTSKEFAYRCQSSRLSKEALAKAIGIKAKKRQLSVIDVTAGFGRDAFILSSLGCKVQLIERSPIIAALLKDGIQRANACEKIIPIMQNMQLIVGDAITILANLTPAQYPDIVYLDPMFPERRKTALVKKEMRALRELVGEDLDSGSLMPLALQVAKDRVVVKRPRLAPPLIDTPAPNFILKGTANRFDVYTNYT